MKRRSSSSAKHAFLFLDGTGTNRARVDYEYRRHGTANLFVVFDRHRCWRNVDVTERRTLDDWGRSDARTRVDTHSPDAERIRGVLDNLNTHRRSALYERFEPEEARRIANRLEFHFTPKHASWLNMVEIVAARLDSTLSALPLPGRRAAGTGDFARPGEILAGQAGRIRGNPFRQAVADHIPAMHARPGAEIEDIIRLPDHVLVVFQTITVLP